MSAFVPTLAGDAAKAYVPGPCADVDAASWWPEAPWTRPADGPVDRAATDALGSIPGVPDVRALRGVPIQTASIARSEVVGHHEIATYGTKNETLPMPDGPLRRTGDPDGSNSDRQAFLVDQDRGLYYEVSNVIPATGLTTGIYRLHRDLENWWTRGKSKINADFVKSVDRVSVFDLDQPWDAVPMNGTAAIKVPMAPTTATAEEFERGYIEHAIQVCVTHYRPKAMTGYARGWDGRTATSPLVAGMVLRLTQRRFEQLVAVWANHPHVVTLLVCLREFGMVVADRTDPKAGHLLRIAQDRRIDLVGLRLVITDFEVVQLTN